MVPSRGLSVTAVARSSRGGQVRRPGKADNTEQVRIAKHSRAIPRVGRRGMLNASGDATTAPRGSRRIPMTAQPSDSGAAATKARTAEPLYGGSASRRVTVRDLAKAKARGEKWPMLTAYDALTAHVFEEAGIPVLLVGDSAGMVVFGHDTTIPVTLDELIPLTAAVVRGTSRALIVADLPFGSYQSSPEAALAAGVRFLKEAGAHAVKLEGGHRVLRQAEELVAAGIPVMGHLGLTPQSVNVFGGGRAPWPGCPRGPRSSSSATRTWPACSARPRDPSPTRWSAASSPARSTPTADLHAEAPAARAAGALSR